MSSTTPRLRPLGVGDLLDEMIRLYRNHFALLVGIAAVALLPFALLQNLLTQLMMNAIPAALRSPAGAAPNDLLLTQLSTVGSYWIPIWIVALFSGVANIAVELAITHSVSEVYLGRRPTIRGAYSAALRRLWRALWLTALVGVAVGLMAITIIGIPFAIYFGVGWILSVQTLYLEGLGIRAAMSRSRALVRGSWWRVLGIGILVGLLGWVASLIAGVILGVVAGFGSLFGTEGLGLALSTAISVVADSIAQVVPTPIWFCGLVLLYYDLRVRKEGFDLELMAREMGTTPQAGSTLG